MSYVPQSSVLSTHHLTNAHDLPCPPPSYIGKNPHATRDGQVLDRSSRRFSNYHQTRGVGHFFLSSTPHHMHLHAFSSFVLLTESFWLCCIGRAGVGSDVYTEARFYFYPTHSLRMHHVVYVNVETGILPSFCIRVCACVCVCVRSRPTPPPRSTQACNQIVRPSSSYPSKLTPHPSPLTPHHSSLLTPHSQIPHSLHPRKPHTAPQTNSGEKPTANSSAKRR